MLTIEDISYRKITKISVNEFDKIYNIINYSGERISDVFHKYHDIYAYRVNDCDNICTPIQLIVKRSISTPHGFFFDINIYHKDVRNYKEGNI